jgi:protein-disulfide isomerase
MIRLLDRIKMRGGLAVLGIGLAAFMVGCGGTASADDEAQAAISESSSQKNGVQEAAPSTVEGADQVAAAVVGDVPAEQGFYQGVAVGFTDEGYPYLGAPDAPVTLEEYSDFLCPFCQRHVQQTWPTLFEEYVKSGQVKYVFRDMPLAALHPTAAAGHAAARCVGEQGAASFWAMHEALFARQNQWSNLPNPTDFLAGVAQEIGVDMSAYQACMASGEKDGQVEASVAAGSALGFNGTPSFQFIHHDNDETYTLIGAYPVASFAQYLDALVAGEAPPQAQESEQAESAELPFWASAEGLAPDPQRPGFTLAGDPYKGSPDAALVVVEFSDFQCPACAQHALEIQPALDQRFVESGEIMWVFKSLPLKEHAQAPLAAVAAECAAEQGQFWEIDNLLFESLDQWATEDADAALLSLAGELTLEMEAFTACYNGRPALQSVLGDLYDAQGVVQSTPTFILIHGGQGHVMRGSRPVEQFISTIESRLEAANAAELDSSGP